jgi:hypothetical protein
MSVLSWGKPKIAFGILGAGGAAPSLWKEMPAIVENSAKLNTEPGSKTEATEEGGGTVDVRYNKSKYAFELELFVKKGDKKPIEDEDGVVLENYALRLIPEDEEAEGFIIDKSNVSCVETWSSADGKRWKYTFDALKPNVGKILKPYLATLEVAPRTLAFAAAADTTGKPIVVTTDGTVTASSDQTWLTTSVSGKTVTAKVTANTGAARSALVTVTMDGKYAKIPVTQEGV